jgi:hypothetical protein
MLDKHCRGGICLAATREVRGGAERDLEIDARGKDRDEVRKTQEAGGPNDNRQAKRQTPIACAALVEQLAEGGLAASQPESSNYDEATWFGRRPCRCASAALARSFLSRHVCFAFRDRLLSWTARWRIWFAIVMSALSFIAPTMGTAKVRPPSARR